MNDLYPSQVKLPEGCSYIDELFDECVEITSITKKSNVEEFQVGAKIKLYEYPILIAEGIIFSVDRVIDIE
ncbi:hypothetical protein [Variovorax sp. PAMC26660]|uniref:hypothetical protein n=1 Tax=Variovorax sp. PAMC26660 TaxID=2762322 RepID=UPI00164DA0C7|nr:hypothetical protein [Variovorax sp. PAMC26660]QNK66858.1 hypothetical protein H7F35_27365 [Variovorax sp. PAMC26660]